jgi:enamine deaminase RidA (YjgF/YER057c/UK114 family)
MTILIKHNPPSNGPHPGPISWGIEGGSPKRVLYISGQVGTLPDGRVAEGFLAQAKCTWDNVGSVLQSAGMTPRNLIRTGIYVCQKVDMTPAFREGFNAHRLNLLGDNRPASTMIFVPALMDPSWLVEIDAVAIET